MRRFLVYFWISLVCVAGMTFARPEYKDAEPKQEEKPSTNIQPSCDSLVYCYGRLLHTIQLSGIFVDSKTFVDMSMLTNESIILKEFEDLMEMNNQEPSKEQLDKFVKEHFAQMDELQAWRPDDFQADPPFLKEICPDEIRAFAKQVVGIWPTLGRNISSEFLQNINKTSILPLTKGFIVPGGRFKETYYWDSYWIIKGLLLSNMMQTTQGMLDNFVTLIKQYGFIPNGARRYYTQRSQPPLFAAMVHEYFKASGDITWLKNNIQYVDKEVSFWLKNRMVKLTYNMKEYNLARYYPVSSGPRPESYKEDYKLASMLPTEEAQQALYTNLKGGAESGWDFSSRWFYDADGGSNGNLSTIDVGRTIPVDLNSFLYLACKSLSTMYFSLGNLPEASKWLERAGNFQDSIRDVLFNERDGSWYDFDIKLKQHRKGFFVSNLTPLWVGAEHLLFDPNKLINKLKADKVFFYYGGTPASIKATGEQWDYPNAWPPLQAIMIQALYNTKTIEGRKVATKLAKDWIKTNQIGYDTYGHMFEKYNAIHPGESGGGGEYNVQDGFGWTNGVVLELIKEYYGKCSK